jgi:hypothetical protein
MWKMNLLRNKKSNAFIRNNFNTEKCFYYRFNLRILNEENSK